MKTSRFNITAELPEHQQLILYNSLHGSLTILESEEIGPATRILSNPNNVTEREDYLRNILIRQKYLVEDSEDELEQVRNRKIQGIKDENRFDLIIMPTLDCNFACTYCYESRRPGRMKPEVETGIKNWLTKELPRYKVLLLHWFGGEPLLGQRNIISITKHAMSLAADTGITCIPRITTNGYLLTPERTRDLIEHGITEFQVTVDGAPEFHNSLRVLRNGNPTFENIFNNIVALARLSPAVRIALRVNFNHTNLYSIPTLLEFFPIDVRGQLRIVYEPIFGSCALSATENLAEDTISRALADYYRLAESMGYDITFGPSILHPGKLVYCYAERASQMIVNYNGDVFKCSVSDFAPDERVGFISADGTLVKIREKWDQWVGSELFEQECVSCSYLPLCMGGCKKMRLQRREAGSCSLVATNASQLLKQIALGGFKGALRNGVLEEHGRRS